MKADRRSFLKLGVAATASAACFPARIFAQGAAPRAVIVGGGFAGASCARALRQADPRIAVAVPYIGVQSFKWSLENGQWRARIATIQEAFDASAVLAGKKDDAELIKRLELLERAQERGERLIREEMARGREENANAAKTQRGELTAYLLSVMSISICARARSMRRWGKTVPVNRR